MSAISNRVFVIAEIGSNFDGDKALAKYYIDAAAEAGADAVKFQTLAKETLIAPYVRGEDGEWIDNPKWAAFSNTGLPLAWHGELKAHCDKAGVEFMSTPFYLEAVDLMEEIGVARYKIASGDMTFAPLHYRVAATGKPVIFSTGASYLDECRETYERLKSGGAGEITVLHCTATYPPSWEDLNLNALTTLREAFGARIGLSDHSPGHIAPIAAAALGARVLEKHVTFSRANKGPDHPFAMEMPELKALIGDLRALEEALGDGEKKPAASEIHRRKNLRRGVYDRESFKAADGEDGIWLRPEI